MFKSSTGNGAKNPLKANTAPTAVQQELLEEEIVFEYEKDVMDGQETASQRSSGRVSASSLNYEEEVFTKKPLDAASSSAKNFSPARAASSTSSQSKNPLEREPINGQLNNAIEKDSNSSPARGRGVFHASATQTLLHSLEAESLSVLNDKNGERIIEVRLPPAMRYADFVARSGARSVFSSRVDNDQTFVTVTKEACAKYCKDMHMDDLFDKEKGLTMFNAINVEVGRSIVPDLISSEPFADTKPKSVVPASKKAKTPANIFCC